jgi:methyl-CpG-binding domain protein 4
MYTPLQAEHAGDGWRVLVVSVLLNRTNRKQVRQVVSRFFARWPDPASAAGADLDEMIEMLAPLGLQRARSFRIQAMSRKWAADDAGLTPSLDYVRSLFGVGPYGRSAYRVFVLNDLSEMPEDGVLQLYVLSRRRQTGWTPKKRDFW